MTKLVPVRVRGLILDERTKSPIVILQEEDGSRVLPIWIGEAEARAINMVLAGETLERPMTHDLFHLVIKGLGARLVEVTINALKDHTFFAELHIERGGEQILIDSRPSDSIALALRCEAGILVDEKVLESSAQPGVSGSPSREEKAARLRKLLDEMNPGDFGDLNL